MHCKHCGFVNGEDDHRCLRCGRRISGVVIAAPPGYSGANALAPAVLTSDDTAEFLAARGGAAPAQPSRQTGQPAIQPTLFTNLPNPGPNVIPFQRREPQTVRLPAPAPAAQPRVNTRRQPASPSPATETGLQGMLDFVPAASVKSRKLKTEVEAQVFCGQPVATPAHRMVASAIDGVIILFGFVVVVALYELLGGSFGTGRSLWIGLGAVLAMVSLFYGLIWVIAGRETAGMRCTDLQLITFDGFPLDPRSRVLRFVSSWLSFCSGGLGLLWAVADEENLTWHDHISKTFPTIREATGTFVRQRR